MKKFLNNKSGATAIEYGLMIALIAFVLIGATTALGEKVAEKLGAVNTGMR